LRLHYGRPPLPPRRARRHRRRLLPRHRSQDARQEPQSETTTTGEMNLPHSGGHPGPRYRSRTKSRASQRSATSRRGDMNMPVELELKSLGSSDIDLDTWSPADEDVFFVLDMEIGEKDDDRADLFYVTVATPEGLLKNRLKETTRPGPLVIP